MSPWLTYKRTHRQLLTSHTINSASWVKSGNCSWCPLRLYSTNYELSFTDYSNSQETKLRSERIVVLAKAYTCTINALLIEIRTSPELRMLLIYSRNPSSLISLSLNMKVIPLPSPPAVRYKNLRSSTKFETLYDLTYRTSAYQALVPSRLQTYTIQYKKTTVKVICNSASTSSTQHQTSTVCRSFTNHTRITLPAMRLMLIVTVNNYKIHSKCVRCSKKKTHSTVIN